MLVRRIRVGLKMTEADDVTARLHRFDSLVRRQALLREGRWGDGAMPSAARSAPMPAYGFNQCLIIIIPF